MSAVNITNVTVLDNPAAFLNPFQFEISYECLIPLADGTYSFHPFIFLFSDLYLLQGSFLQGFFVLLHYLDMVRNHEMKHYLL